MAEFNREEIDYEDQLRQSERERKDLKNIIYELPVGLITVKGGNELTIDIANHEFCRMSGYELADFSMEKMSMAQLIHMEDYMMRMRRRSAAEGKHRMNLRQGSLQQIRT